MLVSLFGIITGFSGIVILYIDRIMIEQLMDKGLYETGIYAIAFNFGILIIMPSRSMLKISSTYIAEAWKNKDVAIVGSAVSLFGNKLGKQIDKHEIVVRVNRGILIKDESSQGKSGWKKSK